MEIKDFIKKVLVDLNDAVDDADQGSTRRMYFSSSSSKSTVEFDVAIAAEQTTEGKGKAGVKVLTFLEGGGEYAKTNKSSTVSRVKFGVDIHPLTREEEVKQNAALQASQSNHNYPMKF